MRTNTSLTTLVALLILFFSPLNLNAQCDGTNDVIQDDFDGQIPDFLLPAGNTFTATCSGKIEGVSFWSSDVTGGNIGGVSVTVDLWSNPSDNNNRTIIATQTQDIPYNNSQQEHYFQFVNQPEVDANEVYAFTINNNETGASNRDVNVQSHENDDVYSGGVFFNTSNDLSIWNFNSISEDWDMRFQVHYLDEAGPNANCRNITRTLGANGTVSISTNDINNGSSDDDSGIAFISISQSNFDCSNMGVNTVTLFVTDQNGNISNCQSTVNIVDETDPVLTCPGDINVAVDQGITEAVVTYDDILYSDCTVETPTGFSFMGVYTDPDGDIRNYYLSDNTIEVEDGENLAEALGGYLVTVIDEDHNDWLREAVNFVTDDTDVQVLIGYTDRNNEGPFFWHAGNENAGYENWNTGEPNNSGDEDFAVLLGETHNRRWNDVNRNDEFRYLLQLPPSTTSTITQTAGLPSGSEFPLGTTTNTFEAMDANGNIGTCSFDVIVEEIPDETSVVLNNGKLTITDIENDSDDQITFSNDGTTLTISNLVAPVAISGGLTLDDDNTVTVLLSSITSGIEFIGNSGSDTVNFDTDLSLTGSDNDITLSGLGNGGDFAFENNGHIDIEGDFTILDSSDAFVFLKELTANNLSITNVDRIRDAISSSPITISGQTDLQATSGIDLIKSATHTFSGLVNLESNSISFYAIGPLQLGIVNTTGGSDNLKNYIRVDSGNLELSDNVTTAGSSDLRLKAQTTMNQTGGVIITDVLTLEGDNNGETTAFLHTDNDVNTLETFANGSMAVIVLIDIDDVAIGKLIMDTATLIAPEIIFTEDTHITKTDAPGSVSIEGNISMTSDSSTSSTEIYVNGGTMYIDGTTIDLTGHLEYTAVSGSVSDFTGEITFPNTGPFTNMEFGTLLVDGSLFVGDAGMNILDEATITTNLGLLSGVGVVSGGPITIENDAYLTPGKGTDRNVLTTANLEINGGVFAPFIDSDTAFDQVSVLGTVVLTDADFAPTGEFNLDSEPEGIILINNDGIDSIIGTFNNLPEGSEFSYLDYSGIISYIGGDGNDVVLLPAPETSVSLSGGKLTITDIENDSDDNIVFSNDGTNLTISNLVAPVDISAGLTLTDENTVTVLLTSITNGIEFNGGEGYNYITFENDLTLTGVGNDITLNGLNDYTQNGSINIQGDFTISNGFGFDLLLGELTANNLTIDGVDKILDQELALTIAGVTQLQASDVIDIDDGQSRHSFTGEVHLIAGQVAFTAGANTTFGSVTVLDTGDGLINDLTVSPGNIIFNGNVSIAGSNANLFVCGNSTISQTSGIIQAPFLILRGNGNSTAATLNNDNEVQALATSNPFDANAVDLVSLSFTNSTNMFLEEIHVNEFDLTAPEFDLEPNFTEITKEGTGVSNFNANIDVNNGTGTVVINHNAGTINFNGDTNDFESQFTYNGAAGTITNINSTTTNFPGGGPNSSFTFGFLNASGTVDIGDAQINILDTFTFSGSNTLATGLPFIVGGPTVIENDATLTPGGGTTTNIYHTNDLIITSGGTYAPLVQGTNISAHDQIAVVGTVTLANGVLAPIGGYPIQAGDEIIIIDNDGTDPVVGTFANLPEGGGVSFGDFVGMISYVGGTGNDVVLVPDTIDPIAICQNLAFEVGLGGVEVNASEIDNGSSDNAEIASILINGETSIQLTYDDLGDNDVTITVTDTSGNTAECTATITLTSSVTLPILISEYQPVISSGVTQDIEIIGNPGESFAGTFVVIDGDPSSNTGQVQAAYDFSGIFDSNGLLTATVPDIPNPTHTVVLTSSFTGTVGATDVDTDDDGIIDDTSDFGLLLDAVGIANSQGCCPFDIRYGTEFGGVDIPFTGGSPSAVFRGGSVGGFYQISNSNGTIYDDTGSIIDGSIFDSTPTENGTFGQINPTVSLDMNAEAFMTTWKTDNPGSSADNQITIFTDSNETYNYIIDWGDGTSDLNVSGNITHTYDTAGTYTVSILGTFPRFISNGSFSGNSLKLLSIDQWGSIAWSSFEDAFQECGNMDVLATDMPDLTNVTSLRTMFFSCTSLVGTTAINDWDVSTIENMDLTFASTANFNQPLDNWNVSNVTTMSSMFNTAESFNQDLNSWNTSQVEIMDFMFLGASQFNGNISNWNVSSVTDMSWMFNYATAFNQDLSNWNTSQVQEMDFMFLGATSFNGDISNWNTGQVNTMNAMFQNATAFNQDVSGWNVTQVTDMGWMFSGATNFNQAVQNWDVSNVTIANEMLFGTAFSSENYDQLLINWSLLTLQNNVSFGTDATFCFGENAKQNIATTFAWTITDGGKNCDPYFITKWETTAADESITIPTTGDGYNYIINWGDGTIESSTAGNPTHIYTTPGEHEIIISGSFPRIYFNNSGDKLKIKEITQWGDNPWVDMGAAFQGCANLVISATDAPNLSNLTNMSAMFRDAGENIDLNLWQDISHWDVSNVTNMSQLFRGMDFNQDIAAWEVGNVTNMGAAFRGNKAFNQDISSWDTSEVTNMRQMFYLASNFNQDVSSWNVSKVTNMSSLFWATDFNHDISSWDVKKVTTMADMFRGTPFNQDLGAWDISSVSNMSGMFNNATMSVNNYDNTLIGWATLDTNAGEIQIPTAITFHGGNSQYCESEFKRFELIDTYGWNITDGGKDANCTNSNSFISIWETTTANESITIPTTGTGYNYIVDWGDGTTDSGLIGNASHTYATAGTYTVSIIGNFPRIYFNFEGDRSKIQQISQWGSNPWITMENAFSGCENLEVTATDAPNLADVTSTNRMFASCINLIGNTSFNTWDVSTIEDMSNMFSSANNFNQDLDTWDVSNVTLMSDMFASAFVFNGNIGTWNTEEVTDMDGMFFRCEAFTGVGGLNSWDVSKVEYMNNMFRLASIFNQDLDNWNVTNVREMNNMFWDATRFNGNISTWNVSNLEEMTQMFYDAKDFNSDISQWNISTNITSLSNVFRGAESFNRNINSWDVSNVTNMSELFFGAVSFNQPLDNWDTSSVGEAYRMFYNATSFNQSLGSWDLSGFDDVFNFNMGEMLANSGISTENYDATLIGWATLDAGETAVPSNVQFGAGSTQYCVSEAKREELIVLGWNIVDGGLAAGCADSVFITVWETTTDNESITIPTRLDGYDYIVDWGDGTIESGFTGDATHTYTTAGEYEVRILGDFPRIYFDDEGDKDKIQKVSQWGTNPWVSMANAFTGCVNLDVIATDIPDLSNVSNANAMFSGCENLVGNTVFNTWDVSTIENMRFMFRHCADFNEDLNNWNVANVEDMSSMFDNAHIFNGDISSWNTAQVTDMSYMFRTTVFFNGNISTWNTAEVTNMEGMFFEAHVFNQNLGGWDISSLTNADVMFYSVALSTENYDNTLIGWATLDTDAGEIQIPTNVTFDGGFSEYCISEAKRQELIDLGWIITDDGQAAGCGNVLLSPKVYLQGAALNPNAGEETLMRDDLRVAGLLPLMSPYGDDTAGSETFGGTGNDNTNIVDWVWVELRDATDSDVVIDGQSALLRRNGDIVATNNNSALSFNIPAGDYFVAISHRNHLGVITANPITLSGTTTALDFTSDITIANGETLALTDVGNGIFAMYAGDATGDGNILNTDISNAISNSGGINVYSGADTNMDGNILNDDIALFIQLNAGRIQQF